MTELEVVRISLAIAMFASASYFDLRRRTVSDLLWIVFGAAAGIIYVFDFPEYGGLLTLISISASGAISYGIYKAGFFGGADALALVAFSVILPLYYGGYSIFGKESLIHPLAPVAVLTNAFLLSISQVVFNVTRNLVYSKHGRLFEGLEHEPAVKKVFAMVVGHRSTSPQYSFPIERIINGKRRFDFSFKSAETTEFEQRKDVWVTSALPFLLYLFAGFIVMIVIGDLMSFIFAPFI